MTELTATWRKLFAKNCGHWSDRDKLRYLSVPNDRDDIDAEELESCRELIAEINKKPPVE